MNVLGIIQARMNSSRLPGKVILPFAGTTIIECIYQRVKQSSRIDEVIVGTSKEPSDDMLVKLLDENKLNYFRGSLNNVLQRFASICEIYKPNFVVRVTGDCPLIDSKIIDICVEKCIESDCDYFRLLEPYPDGMDVEVFKTSALKIANIKAKKNSEREHLGQYFINNQDDFILGGINLFEPEHQAIRITLDEEQDYQLFRELEKKIDNIISIQSSELIAFLLKNKKLLLINNKIGRNDGLKKSLIEEKQNP